MNKEKLRNHSGLSRLKKRKKYKATNNIKYTKRYANKHKRQQAGYEHRRNREINLKKNPAGIVIMRRKYS